MNNFDTDYQLLLEMNERINNERKVVANLENELKSQCSNFLKKHSIQKKLGRLGSIESLLNRGLSAKQLVEFIERSERNEWGLLSKMGALKEHITGVRLDNEILNYNLKVIRELEFKFKTWDSLDDENLNNLFVNNHSSNMDYFIDREIEFYLKVGFKFKNALSKKEYFVYLVVFNTIKQGDKEVLVYNYIPYARPLLKLLYLYAILEQKFFLRRGKKGYVASDFYFVLDKELRDPLLDSLDGMVKKAYPGFHSPDKDYLNLWENESSNFITLVKWLSYGCVRDINFEELGDLELIKALITQNDLFILNFVNKGWADEDVKEYTKGKSWDKVYNILSRFIFIVSDLDKMTSSIENKLKMNVNQGPQKFRGQCSYISHILFSIDKAFRESMYNHNRLYLEKLTCEIQKKERYIPKGCFSFKNIHINLGKVKW